MAIPYPVEPWAASSKKSLVNWVLSGYTPAPLRAYGYLRLAIFNPTIFQLFERNLGGRRRVLDIGCGIGLFSCIFSALNPDAIYWGLDVNTPRIQVARQAALELQLPNVRFSCADARYLELDQAYDAIMMIDFLHHVDDASKRRILATCARHLEPDGVLIVKDIVPCSNLRFIFTVAMDVIVTGGYDLWYWGKPAFQSALSTHFNQVETIPVQTWMPYSHVIYLCKRLSENPVV